MGEAVEIFACFFGIGVALGIIILSALCSDAIEELISAIASRIKK